MAVALLGVRDRLTASARRIRRVKRLDRLATSLITLGGLSIIVGVLFMFIFIVSEAWPLFRPASGHPLPTLTLTAPSTGTEILAFGVDEYQRYVYQLLADGRVVFFRGADGARAREFPLSGLTGARVTAGSRSLEGDLIGAGTAAGFVALAQIHFRPRYEEQKLIDLDLEVRERGAFQLDPEGRGVRLLDAVEREGRLAVAGVVADGEIALLRLGDDGAERRDRLAIRPEERITCLAVGRAETLVAGTDNGRVYHWELDPEPRLTETVKVADRPLGAIRYAVGGNTFLVGDQMGVVSAWFRLRRREEDTQLSLVRVRDFPSLGSPVLAFGPSTRDRSFAVATADGAIVLRHLTSGRTLLRFAGEGPGLGAVLLTPHGDGILAARRDGGLARYLVSNPHPEFSWQALFGKVWYEGFPRPEYVWQSTGATDDFESKLSLVPLVFGTIKGTFYALLFAVPLAIMGALYTSQFVHPSIRAKVKPVVEIMAALPSVVIGFVAGLWLASRVERNLVPVLLMLVLLPALGTSGLFLWQRLPRRFAERLKPGTEVLLILPLLLLGAFTATALGPLLESSLFQGDLRLWLQSAMKLAYDQRNCLVVGLAMGFAVIPIIFTITEDSFSSVPSHLTAASLALGASRWQTAVRAVLPTASPGVFSAIMVGFGRAVGETMIVLMATGNTPMMDWSIFNGMRTLSANIAVEIPEAPYGGTLYRTLFLSGAVLFFMTFLVNTIAELVRQRLRERYRAL